MSKILLIINKNSSKINRMGVRYIAVQANSPDKGEANVE